MKRLWLLLPALLSAAIAGWALGYLRFPLMETEDSFLFGFLTCLAVVLLVFLVNTLLSQEASRKNSKSQPTLINKGSIRRKRSLLILLTLIVCAAVLFLYLELHSHQHDRRMEEEKHEQVIRAELLKAENNKPLVPDMQKLLSRISDEVASNNNGALSEASIANLAMLSKSFTPHRMHSGDSLTRHAYSPERGQLLVGLLLLPFDSATLNNIYAKVIFTGAYLPKAELSGRYLRGIHLEGANLYTANLNNADLDGASLAKSNLWGSSILNASIQNADMQRTNLQCANLRGSNLSFTNLDGAQLTSANLYSVSLEESSVEYAFLDNAFLKNVNFACASLKYSSLRNVNLTGANLSEAVLTPADLQKAILQNTIFNSADMRQYPKLQINLDYAIVDTPTWLEDLSRLKVLGADAFISNYKVAKENSPETTYILLPIKPKH